MNEIYILFIFFSILFLIEKKPINILMNYIGITIIIAIIIGMLEPIRKIEGEYISYILILVQVSALTILFGFLIMLFPRITTNQMNINVLKYPNISKISKYLVLKYLIFLLISFMGYYYYTQYKCEIKGLLGFFIYENDLNFHNQFMVFENLKFKTQNINILRKLGELIFSDNNNIIKLLVLTIILLLAIISLFFLIFV